MIKSGQSRHAYLNNTKDNKWIPSVQSTTSGKAEEKHPREITSPLTTHTHTHTNPNISFKTKHEIEKHLPNHTEMTRHDFDYLASIVYCNFN